MYSISITFIILRPAPFAIISIFMWSLSAMVILSSTGSVRPLEGSLSSVPFVDTILPDASAEPGHPHHPVEAESIQTDWIFFETLS